MIKYFLIWILFYSLQPVIAQSISRHSADSLLQVISEQKQNKATAFAMLQLSQFHILKPHPTKTDLDSTAVLIEAAKNINKILLSGEVEGYIFLQQSNLNKKNGVMASGKQLGLKAVEVLKSENNPALLGKALLAVSDFFAYSEPVELRTRISLVEKALNCFDKTGNIERQAYCLEVLTDISDTSEADFPRVLKMAKQSLEKYNRVAGVNKAGVLINIARLYMDRKEFATALNYCLMALRNIAEIHDSTTLECQINSNIGIIYSEMHEYELAATHMEKALTVAEKFNDTASVRLVGPNLADIYLNLQRAPQALLILNRIITNFGKPNNYQWVRNLALYVEAHSALNKYAKAQGYCNEMLAIANAPGLSNNRMLFVYSQAAQFYINSKQYEKGMMLMPKLKEFIGKSTSFNAQIKAHDLAYRLDSAQHLYQSAIDELIQKDIIKDTMFSVSRNKQIQQLRTEYETYQKEKDIELLQKQALLQHQEIKQSKLARNYFIAGSILLLGLLGLAISRFRLKQRKNTELENKQKEIILKNTQLEKLLHENEWLLKEVHHRVKNNLQVVMSLLNSQSSYLKDEEAVNAVMQSRNRVQAMSLIHQKLYKSDNVSTINMPDYIRELVDYLKDCARPGLNILFRIDAVDVELDVMEAVPVGLILNEAITNSCKYAFPDGINSTVTVKLTRFGINELTLYIADNGIGLPADYDKNPGNSFGMLLIRGMVEDLGGTLKIENTNGAAYTIIFPQSTTATKTLKIA